MFFRQLQRKMWKSSGHHIPLNKVKGMGFQFYHQSRAALLYRVNALSSCRENPGYSLCCIYLNFFVPLFLSFLHQLINSIHSLNWKPGSIKKLDFFSYQKLTISLDAASRAFSQVSLSLFKLPLIFILSFFSLLYIFI